MNQHKFISPAVLVFSKWSRKEFAIFASLGKQIKIGVLKADICQKTLLKGLVDLITIAKNTEDFEEDESDVNIADHSSLQFTSSYFLLLILLIFNLTSLVASQEEDSSKKILYSEHKVCFLPGVKDRLFFTRNLNKDLFKLYKK